MYSDVKTKKALSIFWAATKKKPRHVHGKINDEAVPENNQSSEPKSKLPK